MTLLTQSTVLDFVSKADWTSSLALRQVHFTLLCLLRRGNFVLVVALACFSISIRANSMNPDECDFLPMFRKRSQ